MARPRGDLVVTWNLHVALPLAASIEQLIMDPSTGKPRYGARRRLVEQLLSRYLHEIGFYSSETPIIDRPPLTDEDIERITSGSAIIPLYT